MTLFTSTEWIEAIDDFDHETHYAETSDPRVLAIIEREPNYPREFFMDGDCICPTYYLDFGYGGRTDLNHQGGDRDDAIAEAWNHARKELSHDRYSYLQKKWVRTRWDDQKVLERFMWIFHGTRFERGINEPGDRSGEWIIFSTPDFRKKLGQRDDQAQADVEVWAKEVQTWLDGDVWSIGYAVNEGRLLHDVEVDFDEFSVTIGCGGMVGQEYAKSEAAGLPDGEPKLHPLLVDEAVFA